MKQILIILTIFSLCLAGANSNDASKNRKVAKAPEASFLTKKEQKNAMAFFAVHRGVSKLQVYLTKRDKTSLAPLLEGWSLEDQTLLKRDLANLPKNLQVEVSGQTLFFQVGEEKSEVRVIDAAKGKFQINNKIVHIQTYRKYEMMKKEIESALQSGEQARFQIFRLLLPQAHAVVFAIPAAISAAGGLVARSAVAKFIATKGSETLVLSSIAGTTGAVIGKAVNAPPEQKKTGENEAQIKDADEEPVPVPNPENAKFKCEKKKDGTFIKMAGFIYYRPKDAEALKNQPIDKRKLINSQDFQYDYERHPEDPKKVVLKTISEVVKRADGSIAGERVYKLKDEGGFQLEEMNADLLKKKNDPFYRGVSLAEKKDCTGKKLAEDEVCKALSAGSLALARTLQTCNMENPDEAIRQNKVENQLDEKKSSSPGKK